MIGDIIQIRDVHRKAARELSELVLPQILASKGKFALSIGGESGSGKSEVAGAFAEVLQKKDINSIILQQDDYFELPPRSNDERRRKDIGFVGLAEVQLALLDKNIREILDNESEITKPLVNYQENRIASETLPVANGRVIIAEGTYTTLLSNVHCRIFIDRSNVDTREDRRARMREVPDDWQEKILAIEHEIISKHKSQADILISREFAAVRNFRSR